MVQYAKLISGTVHENLTVCRSLTMRKPITLHKQANKLLENNWGPQINNVLMFQLMLLTCKSIW